MMMTKPSPSASATTSDSKPNEDSMVKKKVSPEDAVKDLEKRLQMLGGGGRVTPTPSMTGSEPTFSAAASAAPASAPAPAAATVKPGKNPLLARIMAAQEKAKQSTPAPSPAVKGPATTTTTDLLDAFDDPVESATAPPPAFDVSLLPPQSQPAGAPPPPAFDDTLLPPAVVGKSSQSATVTWDPSIPEVAPPPSFASFAPPAASAPVFEDLLDFAEEQKMPVSSYDITPVAPPAMSNNNNSSDGLDQDVIDSILGIEGLSDEEKAAMIAEQEKIMFSIEQEKRNRSGPVNLASARADAFEQRSHAAAVQAIGGASTKKSHTPVSQTASAAVSAVDEEATLAQMVRDMELAEQLQKEEYQKADKRQQRATTAASAKAKTSSTTSQSSSAAAAQESSWMDWLGFGSTKPTTSNSPPPATIDRSFAQRPLERGEIGVSLPPGASRNNTALAMAPAYTGQDDDDVVSDEPMRYSSSSRDEGEDTALMGGGAARVAKQQPLFSCVADSITSAASSLYQTVAADDEGNVHGVDTSGLLAVSQAGRGDGSSSSGGYHNMGNNSNSM